jgi:ankyrin repeat protein
MTLDQSAKSLHEAFCRDDVAAIRHALQTRPELRKLINEPIGSFDSPAILGARSKEMLDLLLEYGADINAKSKWWAGGFSLLDTASDDLSAYAISRGAVVHVHAAARLGMMDRLRELIDGDPTLVQSRGGDGKMPLHFARNIEIADFLLQKGAPIDAKDIDHESTPAQHLIGERPEVARHLVERGAACDIFLAAAIGDIDLVKKYLAAHPEEIRARITNERFPMGNPKAGGTIYFWTLGRNFSPHQVAKKFGHQEILKFLLEQSPPAVQLVNLCWFGDSAGVEKILKSNPTAAQNVSGADLSALANAARDDEPEILRLMLKAGLPRDVRGQHGATPLHWAAYHGNREMVKLLLENGAASHLQTKDADFNSTPMGWANHGSENSWCKSNGDYDSVKKLLAA